MKEIKSTDINPDTGRMRDGKFAKGNQLSPNAKRKRTPVQLTASVRAYVAEHDLSLLATKQLEKIARNVKGTFSEASQIRACETLLKSFNVSAEKDIDKAIAEDTNLTTLEMFNALKKGGDAE